MKLIFNSTEYNFSVNGEKLFLQFLLAVSTLSFIYIVSRAMRTCEKQFKKTSKKIIKLKARMAVVLAHQTPMCELILYRNMMRCRHSLVAGYLKDLINEKHYKPETCTNFFQNYSQSPPNKGVSSSSTVLPGRLELFFDLNTKTRTGKENTSEGTGFNKKYITLGHKNKLKDCNINEYKAIKRPLDATIHKTLEGPAKMRYKLNHIEKRRAKIPKQKMNQGQMNRGLYDTSLTVCPALTPRLPLRSFYSKIPTLQKYVNMTLKSSDENSSEILDSNPLPIQNIEEDKVHATVFENGTDVNEVNTPEVHSVISSECESDLESDGSTDQSPPAIPYNNVKNQLKTPLTTINEESAEENCPSE